MTREEAIKELKEDIELYIPLHGTIDDVDRDLPDGRLITALEMAIVSLEEWEKVRQEIEDYKYMPVRDLLFTLYRHLQEVGND